MYTIDKANKIYFIGIGGISMSGLAEILQKGGKIIEGSDRTPSTITKHLESLGITVHIGHQPTNIDNSFDLVVHTAAIKADNPEYKAASALGIPIVDRATLLGHIMDGYKNSVAVAGTHGKTTTTSMLTYILMYAKKDPTILVGAMLDGINGNYRIGQSDYFVTEACEYKNSYHKFFSKVNMVMNIEADHLDFFNTLSNVYASFETYMKNTDDDGYLLVHEDIENIKNMTKGLACEVLTVGSSAHATYRYTNVSYDKHAFGRYDLYKNQEFVTRIELSVPGEHNIENSLFAIAAADCLGLPIEMLQKGIATYKGVHRRFEYKGTVQDIMIYDDYAHHPTAIKKTIASAKNIAHNDLWILFQPHTYSRTASLFEDFSKAFYDADKIIITDIYAAREINTENISSKDLVESIKKLGKDIVYIADFDEIGKYILDHAKKDDMLITMGAGNIHLVGEKLL